MSFSEDDIMRSLGPNMNKSSREPWYVSHRGYKRPRPILYTNVQEVGEFRTGKSTKIVCSVVVNDGIRLITFQKAYWSKRYEHWTYSKGRSLSIPINLEYNFEGIEIINPLKAFTMLLSKAIKVGMDMPLDNPENYVYKMTKDERMAAREKWIAKADKAKERMIAKNEKIRANREAQTKKMEEQARKHQERLGERLAQRSIIEQVEVGFVQSLFQEMQKETENL